MYLEVAAEGGFSGRKVFNMFGLKGRSVRCLASLAIESAQKQAGAVIV